jgi:hypothetical protein
MSATLSHRKNTEGFLFFLYIMDLKYQKLQYISKDVSTISDLVNVEAWMQHWVTEKNTEGFLFFLYIMDLKYQKLQYISKASVESNKGKEPSAREIYELHNWNASDQWEGRSEFCWWLITSKRKNECSVTCN